MLLVSGKAFLYHCPFPLFVCAAYIILWLTPLSYSTAYNRTLPAKRVSTAVLNGEWTHKGNIAITWTTIFWARFKRISLNYQSVAQRGEHIGRCDP